MFIGLLTDRAAGTKITYSYCKRGTDISYHPNLIKEDQEKEKYSVDEKLFQDYVGYIDYKLIYDAIDIKISLGKNCYIDKISFCQGNDSETGDITVLSNLHGILKPVAVLKAQSHKTIVDKEIDIPIGIYADNFIIRINGVSQPVIIGKLRIYGACELEKAVYPIPKIMKEKEGYLKNITGVCFHHDDEKFAANHFIEKLSDTQIKTEGVTCSPCGNISFNLSDLDEEEFTICVTENAAEIKGGSRRALVYASEKLLQLCSEEGIRCCEIKDNPFMKIRGVHFALPDRKQIPYLKNIIKYVFVPMGYNTAFIEIAGVMEYKKHPEINDAWIKACRKYEAGEWPKPAHYSFLGHDILTHEEVADLCDYIRSFGLDVVPEVQTFGHCQYITTAYPDMGETDINFDRDIIENVDLRKADVAPSKFYMHSMCPNHPDYYKIIFDIMDEVIDVMKPQKYVHIGHDEIYTIRGNCERCRDIPEEEIYATEVIALYNHLKEKGLGTMMWSDMLQETNYATCKAIDMIPKDIICLSFTWYFHLDQDVEDVLYHHDFNVMLGNFYSRYPRFNKRKYSRNIIGAEVSTWVLCDELHYGFEGKFYDFLYAGNMIWDWHYDENLRLTYGEIINKFMKNIQRKIGNRFMSDDAEEINFSKNTQSVPYDLRDEFTGAVSVGIHEEISIPINKTVNKISFLHATDKNGHRVMWTQPHKIGVYVIEYDDGMTEEEEILYGANICEYKRRYAQPIGSQFFSHEGFIATCIADPLMGKTCEGEDYTLYNYTWVNPNRGKTIKKITLKYFGDHDVKIILFAVKTE